MSTLYDPPEADPALRAALAACVPGDVESTRPAFEAYFLESRRGRGQARPPTFHCYPDGTYRDDPTQRHWWTWQQAVRASTPPGSDMPLAQVRSYRLPDGARIEQDFDGDQQWAVRRGSRCLCSVDGWVLESFSDWAGDGFRKSTRFETAQDAYQAWHSREQANVAAIKLVEATSR